MKPILRHLKIDELVETRNLSWKTIEESEKGVRTEHMLDASGNGSD